MEQKDLMNIEQVSEYLGTPVSWVRSAIFKKQIPYLKLNRLVRISKADLDKWLESKKRTPK